jgi:hypothetical protein
MKKPSKVGTCDECFQVANLIVPVAAYFTGYCQGCYYEIFEAPIEVIKY